MLALAETSRCTNSAAASRRRTSAIVMLHAACEKRSAHRSAAQEPNEVVPSDETRMPMGAARVPVGEAHRETHRT